MELDASDYDDITSVKIVLLGDRAVGKTSIIRRYISDEFDGHQNVFLILFRLQLELIICSRL